MVQRSAPTAGTDHRPVRMCVGCRRRAETSELVRVVAQQRGDVPRVVVDSAKTMPGRGAWLHADAECISAATRRRAFAAALRTPGLTADPDDLAEQLGVVTHQGMAPRSRNR
ncbi:YlxR family protein [Gordonia paraffinivorans]|uniref:YlxR family protein n=2 Tax=Gordonia paraffinivorans TaxID=175628 RepID=UPI002897895D|nr:YlxR family protein [Gordonia paraffinivorans]